MSRPSRKQFGHIADVEKYLNEVGAGSTRVRDENGNQQLWSDLGDHRTKSLHVRTGEDGKIGPDQSTAIVVFLRMAGYMVLVLAILVLAALALG